MDSSFDVCNAQQNSALKIFVSILMEINIFEVNFEMCCMRVSVSILLSWSKLESIRGLKLKRLLK